MISNTGSSLQTDTRILESKQNPDKCNVTTSDKVLFLLLNSQVKYYVLTVGSKEVSFRISRGHPGLSGSGHGGARLSKQAPTTKGASVYLSLGLLIPSWRAIARDRGARTGDGLCFDLRAVSLMDGSRNTQSKDHQNCCLPWNNSKKQKSRMPQTRAATKMRRNAYLAWRGADRRPTSGPYNDSEWGGCNTGMLNFPGFGVCCFLKDS